MKQKWSKIVYSGSNFSTAQDEKKPFYLRKKSEKWRQRGIVEILICRGYSEANWSNMHDFAGAFQRTYNEGKKIGSWYLKRSMKNEEILTFRKRVL